MTLDLGKLTLGERLWLWRHSTASKVESRRGVAIRDGARRSRNRVVVANQTEAAVALSIDASAYWAAEHDRLPKEQVAALLGRVEEPPYGLKDALKVARRRSSMTPPQVAVGVGVGSRPTLYKLEAAADLRVVAFWRERGFRFPRKFPIYFNEKRE